MKKYRVTKITDDRFDGEHPNGINAGYVAEGYMPFLPTEGEMFYLGHLRTSTVTQALDKNGIFKTNNSTYKLEYIDEEV